MKMPKMKLYLAKPDLVYFEQFNEMMKEWCDDNCVPEVFVPRLKEALAEL